ncbi:MAG: hypothetical protein E7610_00415 [Ruminococcaceae bacterium]|nr:hypothetical protein [Oscillospiraceae bacterium]
MKRILTILISLTLLPAALGSLSACSGGVSRDEAKEATDAYFAAMAAEHYEEAAALFHPATSMTAELMESTAETLRTEMGADFDEGVTIERYVGMKSAYYDSSFGGSVYELTMEVKVGAKTLTVTTEVVRTDEGYGLWNVHYNE